MAKRSDGKKGKRAGRKKTASRRTTGKSAKKKRRSAKKKGGAAGKRRATRAAKPAGRSGKSSAKAKKGRRKSGQKSPTRSSGTASTRPSRRAGSRKTTRRGDRGAAFFDHFRERLLAERQQIARRLDELREELRGIETTPRELEEWAQEEKDRDILIRLEERETEELRRIQAALGLIGTKEYGMCQVCGKPIPRARLEELPTAFRCIEHTP